MLNIRQVKITALAAAAGQSGANAEIFAARSLAFIGRAKTNSASAAGQPNANARTITSRPQTKLDKFRREFKTKLCYLANTHFPEIDGPDERMAKFLLGIKEKDFFPGGEPALSVTSVKKGVNFQRFECVTFSVDSGDYQGSTVRVARRGSRYAEKTGTTQEFLFLLDDTELLSPEEVDLSPEEVKLIDAVLKKMGKKTTFAALPKTISGNPTDDVRKRFASAYRNGTVSKLQSGSFGSVYKYGGFAFKVSTKEGKSELEKENNVYKAISKERTFSEVRMGKYKKHYVLDLPLGFCDALDFFNYMWDVVGEQEEKRRAAQRLATRFVSDVYAQLKRNHEKGVAHRDIKPDNVIVCKTADNKIYFKIVDYGLAVTGGENSDHAGGTPSYMPPEGVSAFMSSNGMSFDLSKKQDLWGAGLCFHYALTGTLPLWFEIEDKCEELALTDKDFMRDALKRMREAYESVDGKLRAAAICVTDALLNHEGFPSGDAGSRPVGEALRKLRREVGL